MPRQVGKNETFSKASVSDHSSENLRWTMLRVHFHLSWWVSSKVVQRSHPHTPWKMGPRMFHHQFVFWNFFRIVGAKGEVWGPIFPGALWAKSVSSGFSRLLYWSTRQICGVVSDLYNGHPISKGICWGVSKGAERNCSLPKIKKSHKTQELT